MEKKLVTEFQTLGYDQDFRLIKDFLSYLYADETTQPPEAGRMRLAKDEGETAPSLTGSFYRELIKPIRDGLVLNYQAVKQKSSFLVFKNQKYKTVSTKDIAFFYITSDSASMMCFDGQEFTLNKSLDSITNSVSPGEFFRANRKFLINFSAIKEVEHYFLRKLFVKLVVDSPEQILINKEKTQNFLTWMEDR